MNRFLAINLHRHPHIKLDKLQCTLGNAVHRDLCFPSRQRLRHCSRPFIHRQWPRKSSSRQAPAEQYTPITVLSSGRKHLDRV